MKKLSERRRREIMRRLAAGERRRDLSAEFGVSYDRIAEIDRRQKTGIFRGLPTPAMQAWIKAGSGEQLQPVQVMSVAMMEAAVEAQRQKFVASIWCRHPKLARRVMGRAAAAFLCSGGAP
jgi:Helix-turn-helix domain